MPRETYVFDPVTKELVPKDEYRDRYDPKAAYVMPDIQPYKSMVTGEMIQSRSRHREHLRDHGMIEVGNEKMMNRKPDYSDPTRKRQIAEIINSKYR